MGAASFLLVAPRRAADRVLKALLLKELRLAVRSRRVWWTALAMTLLGAIAAAAGGAQHAARQALHQDLSAYGAQSFGAQRPDHPHAVAHNGYVVSRPPAPLGYLDAGVEAAYGRWLRLDAHQTRPLAGARTAELTRGPGAGRFDLGLLLAAFAPLLVILLGYDQIVREKRRGTWAMMRSAGARPGPLVVSKLGGLAARTLLAVLLPSLVCLLVLTAKLGTLDLRAALWISGHLLSLLVWCAVVLLLSALARTVQGALLLGVALWATLALFLPPLAGGLARVVAPVPPPGEAMVKAAAFADSAHAQSEKLRSAALQDIRRRHPSWDGTGEPPEVVDAVMLRLADAKASGRMLELFDRMDREADRQERLAATFATLSPTGLASLLSSGLAGSDLPHLRASFRHFEAYRVTLMAWFNDWWAKQGGGGFDDYDKTRFDAFEDAPRPPPFELPLEFALRRAALPAALLALAGLLAVVALWWAVKRQLS